MTYSWAVNKSKLDRAIKEVRGDNVQTGEVGTKEVTEEEVKKVYVRMLGQVKETGGEEAHSVEGDDAPPVRGRGRPRSN